MENPITFEKADQHWLHIAFHLQCFLQPGWRWTLPLGWWLFYFRVITINPTFITTYGLGKEVWVIADMLLKANTDFQLMLFWSSVSSLGTNFAAIKLMLSLSNKMLWHVPCDTSTMLQTS
jgi:hypothetical protein